MLHFGKHMGRSSVMELPLKISVDEYINISLGNRRYLLWDQKWSIAVHGAI